MILLPTYAIYTILSLAMTIWVGRTLYKNGRFFLIDAFQGNKELANSFNNLLVVGFYLINFGYLSLALKMPRAPSDVSEAVEMLSSKIGWLLLVLGGMHFLNIFIFSKFRRSSVLKHAQ